ncbi:hypothetical protein V8E54_002735 [Elaphomyces granulatus]
MSHTALILRLLQAVTPPITAVSSIISSPRRAYPSPRASAKGQSNSNELNNFALDNSLLGELTPFLRLEANNGTALATERIRIPDSEKSLSPTEQASLNPFSHRDMLFNKRNPLPNMQVNVLTLPSYKAPHHTAKLIIKLLL